MRSEGTWRLFWPSAKKKRTDMLWSLLGRRGCVACVSVESPTCLWPFQKKRRVTDGLCMKALHCGLFLTNRWNPVDLRSSDRRWLACCWDPSDESVGWRHTLLILMLVSMEQREAISRPRTHFQNTFSTHALCSPLQQVWNAPRVGRPGKSPSSGTWRRSRVEVDQLTRAGLVFLNWCWHP